MAISPDELRRRLAAAWPTMSTAEKEAWRVWERGWRAGIAADDAALRAAGARTLDRMIDAREADARTVADDTAATRDEVHRIASQLNANRSAEARKPPMVEG
jgi:hypothetical protein